MQSRPHDCFPQTTHAQWVNAPEFSTLLSVQLFSSRLLSHSRNTRTLEHGYVTRGTEPKEGGRRRRRAASSSDEPRYHASLSQVTFLLVGCGIVLTILSANGGDARCPECPLVSAPPDTACIPSVDLERSSAALRKMTTKVSLWVGTSVCECQFCESAKHHSHPPVLVLMLYLLARLRS